MLKPQLHPGLPCYSADLDTLQLQRVRAHLTLHSSCDAVQTSAMTRTTAVRLSSLRSSFITHSSCWPNFSPCSLCSHSSPVFPSNTPLTQSLFTLNLSSSPGKWQETWVFFEYVVGWRRLVARREVDKISCIFKIQNWGVSSSSMFAMLMVVCLDACVGQHNW